MTLTIRLEISQGEWPWLITLHPSVVRVRCPFANFRPNQKYIFAANLFATQIINAFGCVKRSLKPPSVRKSKLYNLVGDCRYCSYSQNPSIISFNYSFLKTVLKGFSAIERFNVGLKLAFLFVPGEDSGKELEND